MPENVFIPNEYKHYFLTNRYNRIIQQVWDKIILLNYQDNFKELDYNYNTAENSFLEWGGGFVNVFAEAKRFDGDEIPDGFEIYGWRFEENNSQEGCIKSPVSDYVITKTSSDSSFKTNPLKEDTDGDGILDYYDLNPNKNFGRDLFIG